MSIKIRLFLYNRFCLFGLLFAALCLPPCLFSQEEEIQQNIPQETQQNVPQETRQNIPQETQPNTSQEPRQNVPQETRRNIPQETRRDALQNYRIGREMESRGRMDEANVYYNEAIRICNEEISRDASNMNAYTVITWTLLRQRRYTEVISWGDRGLRINNNDYRIVETMGEAYFYLNDYARSLRAMQRYVNAMPREERASTAYFFMGEIYRNQQKYLHADIAYTTAVNLESRIVLWWLRLASVRELAGELVPAIAAYEKVLSLTPDNKEAGEALERVRRQSRIASPGM